LPLADDPEEEPSPERLLELSRLSAAYQQGLLTLQRKRTGGSQHVTVKHIHQQVNVTEGGQAVVAGDTVTRGQGERRRGMIEK
jgi:hypothetical protein